MTKVEAWDTHVQALATGFQWVSRAAVLAPSTSDSGALGKYVVSMKSIDHTTVTYSLIPSPLQILLKFLNIALLKKSHEIKIISKIPPKSPSLCA